MEKLHYGAKWIFFFQSLVILFGLYILLISPIIRFSKLASSFFSIQNNIDNIFTFSPFDNVSIFFILVSSVILILLSILWSTLNYNNWQYEFRQDGLYIQKGVIWKHYSSVPYERIQNIDITRGILARIFGFSALMIQTAGYSSSKWLSAEGTLPIIDSEKAEKYREMLLKKIKGERQGL